MKTIPKREPRYWRRQLDAKAKSANDRAKEYNVKGRICGSDLLGLYREQNGICAYCQQAMNYEFTPDHIQPMSKGGCNYRENIVLCCMGCNKDKSGKLLHEWDGWFKTIELMRNN